MLYIVSELYYPEETSTGHFLTKIAEGLADKQAVTVLCSQPTYSQRGILAPKREVRNKVIIHRSWGGRLNKNHLAFRVFNFLTISLSLFLSGLFRFGRDDKVIVVTNPPLLPFLITLAAKVKRSKTVLLVHDVYPEVLIAAGILKSGAFFYKFILKLNKWLYKSVERIVVIGRDMQKLAISKSADLDKVRLITNWADLDIIHPLNRSNNNLLSSMGLSNKFVVQYCGNMGRTHGLEYLLRVAEELYSNLPDLHFLMIGSGAKKKWLEQQVSVRKIENMSVRSRCARDELNETINACDIAVISFAQGMSGVSVPSRMYNIMAAGKPILAITDSDSELAMVVREEKIGWVVSPGDIEDLKNVLHKAISNKEQLLGMGERARKVAQLKYSLDSVVNSYREFLDTI